MERLPRFSLGQLVREFDTGRDYTGVVEIIAEIDGDVFYQIDLQIPGFTLACWFQENCLIAILD